MSIKIFDPNEKVSDDIYLYLHKTYDGITLGAKTKLGDHLYDILTIREEGLHLHNLKAFINKTPFPLQSGIDHVDGKRIVICRM